MTAAPPTDSDLLEDGSELSVRPFGYVENRPAVRQLGERALYLGNMFAARPTEHDHEFEFVLSLTAERYPLTKHHAPLVDGAGNEWDSFAGAVETARSLYGRRVLSWFTVTQESLEVAQFSRRRSLSRKIDRSRSPCESSRTPVHSPSRTPRFMNWQLSISLLRGMGERSIRVGYIEPRVADLQALPG